MDHQPITHSVDLVGGYVDDKHARHTRVVFGHRITGPEMLALDNFPAAQIPTQRNDLILSKEIVKFGELIMPVALSVLLDLADYDRELLMEAQNEFAALSSEGRTIELLEDRAKLAFGFKIDDVIYDRVEFGKHNTGRDEVEADRLRLSGLSRECFLVGKQISALKTSDGSGVIDGPIELERFESLVDGGDIVILRGAAFLWRQTFRLSGEKVSRNGRSADGTDSRHKDGLERGKDSGAPAGTA